MAFAQKILIVDDDDDWRALVRMAIEDLGYQVEEARGGAEALELMSRERYSILLLDMWMPGMSGAQLLERLSPDDAPRVVFLTASSADEVNEALSQGAHYYLPKGASREELALLLESLTT